MGKTKDSVASLGRQVLNDRKKQLNRHLAKTNRHVFDLEDSKTTSVTENTTLDEFLMTAQMANVEFTAERQNIQIVDPKQGIVEKKVVDNKEALMIPRRPKWDEETTGEELNQMEYDLYLEWRRHLAHIETTEDIIMTPFEKNIEFWRQLWRVVERSDVCIQILDARNPLLFISEDLMKYVKEVNENKINCILMNKSDFLTQTQREIWAKHFDTMGVKALFFSAKLELESDEDIDDLSPEVDDNIDSVKNSGKLLSRKQLIHLFKSLKSEDTSEPITIGLVGYPNVGKSSTINAIMKSKKVSVSATPGKTKHFQTLIVDNELTLCDCPGLVFPNIVSSKAEMIINGILPIDHLKDPIPPIGMLTSRIPRHVFEDLYTITLPQPTEFEDHDRCATPEELLTTYGFSRGFMTQRGIPDNSRSSRYILKDFVNGKLLYCFGPPNCDQKSYHEFIDNSNQTNTNVMSGALKRILESSQITQKDFNSSYFGASFGSAHTKGLIPNTQRRSASQTDIASSSGSLSLKPWKKHNNRNKKEKLRRIYAHLDE